MQFILEMQAKHEVQIAKNEAQIAQNSAQIGTLADLVGRLAQAENRVVERIRELAESQAHSDRRLDALIDVVDKLAGRNGGARKA